MEFRAPRTHWEIEAHDKEGNLLWTESIDNLVTDEGINFLLDKMFRGLNYTAAWYIGLINDGGVLATSDTAAAHSGWTENASYTNLDRAPAVFGTVANKTADNTANRGTFTMTASANIMGVFLATGATKSGVADVIYSEAAFVSGTKNLAQDAVLTVTVTVSGA